MLRVLPKKWCGRTRQANTGSAPSPAQRAQHTLDLPDAVAGSRFALIAGEGARVPGTNGLVPDWMDFLGKAYLERLPFELTIHNDTKPNYDTII